MQWTDQHHRYIYTHLAVPTPIVDKCLKPLPV